MDLFTRKRMHFRQTVSALIPAQAGLSKTLGQSSADNQPESGVLFARVPLPSPHECDQWDDDGQPGREVRGTRRRRRD
jgi:hypothetical protein